jgi:anti-sigma factor RsiW
MTSFLQFCRNLLRALFGRPQRMISCAEFENFILEYIEGSLHAGQREIFERHLAACDACRAYLAGYRQTVALGKAVFASAEAPVPQDVPEELVQAILKARTG